MWFYGSDKKHGDLRRQVKSVFLDDPYMGDEMEEDARKGQIVKGLMYQDLDFNIQNKFTETFLIGEKIK